MTSWVNYTLCILLWTIYCLSVVSASDFCLESKNECSAEALSRLKPNDHVIIRATKPCRSEAVELNCSITKSDSSGRSTVLANLGVGTYGQAKKFVILSNLKVTSEMDGATVLCQQWCNASGSWARTNKILRLQRAKQIVTPTSIAINLTVTKLWAVGKQSKFEFRTEGSMPKPVHRCWLLTAYGNKTELTKLDEGSATLDSRHNLRTRFTAVVTEPHEGGSISCHAELDGESTYSERTVQLPRLLKPCKTRFILPRYSWIDENTVNLTVDSSDDNMAKTSHICYLNTDEDRNLTLNQTSHSAAISTFSVTVRRQWGISASVLCQANQSGIFETWARDPLPAALYEASAPVIIGLDSNLYEDVNITFSVESNDGNPLANHSCSAENGIIAVVSQSSDLQSVKTQFSFTPHRDDSLVLCSAVQLLDNDHTIFRSSYNQSIRVNYLSNNTLLISPNGWITEGVVVNVTLISEHGLPATKHIGCWIGSIPLLGADDKAGSSLEAGSLIQDLWFKASREHNKMTIQCKFEQDQNLIEWKNTSLVVIHPVPKASVSLISRTISSGSTAHVELLTFDLGNPPARHACSVGGRNLTQVRSPSVRYPSSYWTFIAQPADNGMRISCQIAQFTASNGSTVFDQLVLSDSLNVLYRSNNSWNATRPLFMTEGDPLTVALESVGGNPEPSHECWLQTANSTEVNMTEIHVARVEAQLVTDFMAKSSRIINNGSVLCRVSQGNRDIDVFNQSVTVFFKATTVSWSGQLMYGTDLMVTALTDEGNPRPELHCWLNSTHNSSDADVNIPEPDLIRGSNGGWIRQARILHRFNEKREEVKIKCRMVQRMNNSTDYFHLYESSVTLKPEYPKASAAQIAAALGCSFMAAVAVVAVVAVATRLCRRLNPAEESSVEQTQWQFNEE